MEDLLVNKERFICKIADIYYEIEYQYNYMERMFHDYIVDIQEVKSDYEIVKISYTEDDYRDVSETVPKELGEPYIEYTCILIKIAELLPSKDMLLMHGATIEYHDKAYVFTAPSGTGKSTHISLWRKYLGDVVTVINGDKPEVSFDDTQVYVHGAPWCGKEGWQTNKSAPLAGVCLVRRGTENKIARINPGQYIEFFISQFYIGMENDAMIKVIDLFQKMAERVPFYLLECDISEDAARCSFETLTGEVWQEHRLEIVDDK